MFRGSTDQLQSTNLEMISPEMHHLDIERHNLGTSTSDAGNKKFQNPKKGKYKNKSTNVDIISSEVHRLDIERHTVGTSTSDAGNKKSQNPKKRKCEKKSTNLYIISSEMYRLHIERQNLGTLTSDAGNKKSQNPKKRKCKKKSTNVDIISSEMYPLDIERHNLGTSTSDSVNKKSQNPKKRKCKKKSRNVDIISLPAKSMRCEFTMNYKDFPTLNEHHRDRFQKMETSLGKIESETYIKCGLKNMVVSPYLLYSTVVKLNETKNLQRNIGKRLENTRIGQSTTLKHNKVRNLQLSEDEQPSVWKEQINRTKLGNKERRRCSSTSSIDTDYKDTRRNTKPKHRNMKEQENQIGKLSKKDKKRRKKAISKTVKEAIVAAKVVNIPNLTRREIEAADLFISFKILQKRRIKEKPLRKLIKLWRKIKQKNYLKRRKQRKKARREAIKENRLKREKQILKITKTKIKKYYNNISVKTFPNYVEKKESLSKRERRRLKKQLQKTKKREKLLFKRCSSGRKRKTFRSIEDVKD